MGMLLSKIYVLYKHTYKVSLLISQDVVTPFIWSIFCTTPCHSVGKLSFAHILQWGVNSGIISMIFSKKHCGKKSVLFHLTFVVTLYKNLYLKLFQIHVSPIHVWRNKIMIVALHRVLCCVVIRVVYQKWPQDNDENNTKVTGSWL